MIVFGWNSFNLTSYTPSTIGLPGDMDTQFSIERRQKYFHLFWIPFFPIGQTWALRMKTDGKLYEPAPQMEQLLNLLRVNHKTPWYSFALFFVAIAAGTVFMISEQVDRYTSKIDHERYLAERHARFTQAIASPAVGTYYVMRNDQSNEVYFKVVSHDQESLVCVFSDKSGDRYSDGRFVEAFVTDQEGEAFDTVRIVKTSMLKTFDKESFYGFRGAEVLDGKGLYSLYEAKVYPLPFFKSLGVSYQGGEFTAVLQNIGESATLNELTISGGNMQFDMSEFPMKIKHGDIIVLDGKYLTAEPRFYGNASVTSASDSTTKFNLSVSGSSLSLQPAD